MCLYMTKGELIGKTHVLVGLDTNKWNIIHVSLSKFKKTSHKKPVVGSAQFETGSLRLIDCTTIRNAVRMQTVELHW